MRKQVGISGKEDVQGGRFREAQEVWVVVDIEVDGGDFAAAKQASPIGVHPQQITPLQDYLLSIVLPTAQRLPVSLQCIVLPTVHFLPVTRL